ncbi:TetR/AcrR family transcriptional regulator [Mycobacterium neglectum]|uniref:TetR/AcrR family transcriptional regulator n=1 Tax=Mycobacterium neglectum TaxID=242737 RepID=UPI00159BC2ED|nr:TetR/AcrR family transcriptional regulator [Mycobacterium neglectum]
MPKVSEEHRAARREQIIDAMLRCVARDGFHKTSMAAVVAESGLSAGAVYLYFKGKSDLIRAIAELVAGQGLSVVLDRAAVDVPPPHQVLASVLERVIAIGDERGVELHRVALQVWAEAARDHEIMAIYRREGGRGLAAWATYVERAITAGHLPSDADPARTAHTLIGLIPGFMVQRLFFEDLTPASYAAGLADLMGDPDPTR